MATIRKRPNGRWQAIIRRTNVKASKAFDRKADAEAWARRIEHDAELGRAGLPGKVRGTVGDLIDRYEREVWPVKRWGSSKTHELKMLHQDLGNRLLADLSQQAILTYARGLDLTGGGISGRLSYLREVVNTARDLWGTPVPLAEVDGAIAVARRMKIAGKSAVRTRRPTQAELDRIIAFADGQKSAQIDLAAMVRVLAVLPLRAGELLGIQWADLNAKRRTAVIRSRKHPDVRVRETNDQEVPLITFKGVDTFTLVADRPAYLPSPFPYKRTSVSSAFWHVAARCQIHDLHIHDLRAHAISTLLEAGVDIPQVALISGHKNWKILQRNYARLDPASVHDALKRLS